MTAIVQEECVKYLKMCQDRNSVVLTNMPLSPSSNNQYALIRRGNKTFHVASQKLKEFQQKMYEYPMSCQDLFLVAKHMVSGWVHEGKHLEFRSIFFFHNKKLFTKQGKPKRLDCSNRIKALHDSVSKLLEIDDSIFFKIYAEKAVCHDSIEEMACVEILPC